MKVNKNVGATGQSNLKNSGKNNNEVIYKVHNREQLDALSISIQQLWTKNINLKIKLIAIEDIKIKSTSLLMTSFSISSGTIMLEES